MHICNKIIFHIFVTIIFCLRRYLQDWFCGSGATNKPQLLSMYFCACVGKYTQIIGIEWNFLTVTLSPLHKKIHLKNIFKPVIKNPVTGCWTETAFFLRSWSGSEDRPLGRDSPVPRGLCAGWLGDLEKAISLHFPTFNTSDVFPFVIYWWGTPWRRWVFFLLLLDLDISINLPHPPEFWPPHAVIQCYYKQKLPASPIFPHKDNSRSL